MEKQIKIAAKLYECRETVKSLYKDEYQKELKPYKEAIENYMKLKGVKNELDAVIEIAQWEEFKDRPYTQIKLFAAAVELVEPVA